METKVCKKCGIEKNIEEIVKYSKNNKIYYSECKDCRREYSKKYFHENKEKYKENKKKWIENNKEHIRQYAISYKPKKKIIDQKYRLENKEIIKKRAKKYNDEHKEQRNKREYERRKKDNVYNLKTNIRLNIVDAFKRKKINKNKNTIEILGCDIDFFVNYLLETYKKNYGIEWDGIEKVHIDHIIPLATAQTEKEVIKLCNFTNLQLLKAKDNLKKKDKLDWKW